MIVSAISFCEVLNSTNISFINEFRLPCPGFSFALTEACDATCIVSKLLGGRNISVIGSILAPVPFLLFNGFRGSKGENSCNDWVGVVSRLRRIRACSLNAPSGVNNIRGVPSNLALAKLALYSSPALAPPS
jgi:hypothetical protein